MLNGTSTDTGTNCFYGKSLKKYPMCTRYKYKASRKAKKGLCHLYHDNRGKKNVLEAERKNTPARPDNPIVIMLAFRQYSVDAIPI